GFFTCRQFRRVLFRSSATEGRGEAAKARAFGDRLVGRRALSRAGSLAGRRLRGRARWQAGAFESGLVGRRALSRAGSSGAGPSESGLFIKDRRQSGRSRAARFVVAVRFRLVLPRSGTPDPP